MAKRPTVKTYPRKNSAGETTSWRAKVGREWVPGSYETENDALKAGLLYLENAGTGAKTPLTVAMFTERWTRAGGSYTLNRGISTNRHNRERVKLFADVYGDKLLVEIDREIAREFVAAHRSRGPALRAMFGDALESELIAANPFARLKLPGMVKRTRKDIEPLTVAELNRLADCVKAIANEEIRPMFRALILFAAYTGMRQGEQGALRWRNIDFENGLIHVEGQWSTKDNMWMTRKGQDPDDPGIHTVLFPQAAAALWSIKEHYGTALSAEASAPDLIFVTPRGARLTQRNHFYYWSPVRTAFLAQQTDARVKTLKGLHWHDLRHFTASWLLDQGVSSRDAAEQLGHEDGGRLIDRLYGHTYRDNSLARMREIVASGGPINANGNGTTARKAKAR